MGERRKWDKQASADGVAFGGSSATSSAVAANASGDSDPVLEKQMQYIKMLEERNRLKKKLAVASKKEQHTKQREDAFVTTFTQEGGGVRKNKSSTALLPTKMTAHGHTNSGSGGGGGGGGDTQRGRSAPSTTLPLRHTPRVMDADGESSHEANEAKQEPPTRRAKWSKPAAGASFGVESRNGKARLCVGVHEESKSVVEDANVAAGKDSDAESDEEKEEEESYLEESFEDFEADGRSEGDDDGDGEDDEVEEDEMKPSVAMLSAASSLAAARHDVARREEERVTPPPARAESKQQQDASASSRLSQTTTELFSIIQNLSRSKQKTLVEVLQKFESSEQQASDVQQLRMSIGDPAVWQQVTAALFSESVEEEKNEVQTKGSEVKKPGLTVAHVMEEQLKWEEEYARQMQERLAKEREAKEQVLREAEARRTAMLKQMEDEERELELLMERKRQERLAKMRALEQDEDLQSKADVAAITNKVIDGPAKAIQSVMASPAQLAPAKSPASAKSPRKKGKKPIQDSSFEAKGVSASRSLGPDDSRREVVAVPVLNFTALQMSPDPIQGAKPVVEMRLRLLSTWGNTRAAGLTQICAYDANGGEIAIDVGTVKIYEQTEGRPLPKSHEMMRTIARLFNGVAQTTNEHEMWLGRLSDHGLLEIAFEVETTPSKLCVWNFNSKMCSACTRDVELLVGSKSVWSGSLPQGFGDEDDNVCTWITVSTNGKKMVRSSTARDHIGDRGKIAESSTSSSRAAVSESTNSSSSGAPIWLGTSSLTSALATSKPPVKADAKDDRQLELTPRSGSLTSRRQRGESDDVGTKHVSMSSQSKIKDVKDTYTDAKASRADEKLTAKESPDFKPPPGAHTSVVSPSWDTLEHFSKTSRSRLPSATESERVSSSSIATTEALQLPSKFVPTTTSSLLAELRGDTNNPGIASIQHGSPTPAAVDIPELPSGRRLKLEILSTWGDQYYVGLNGIELFDQRGQPVTFSHPERQVTACPSSINVLDEYDDDPRVAKNLVDGVNCTSDDFHMWLAPYSSGEEHFVMLDLERSTSISMVRIWNYNKSRAHTFRGARHVRLMLSGDAKKSDSGCVIFEGEIKRAPGGIWRGDDNDESGAMWCEVILFTTDSTILTKIEANDALLKAYGQEEEEEEVTSAMVANVRSSMELQRPRTADNGSELNNDDRSSDESGVLRSGAGGGRPTTSAKRPVSRDHDVRKSVDAWMSDEPQQRSPTLTKVIETDEDSEEETAGDDCDGMIRGRRITIRLLSTWGDKNYIGLTQLDVLVGNHGTPLPLDVANIDATPRDLATLGYSGDPRTLDKLINGVGTTCDDANMWLIPLGTHQEIRIDLKRDQYIYGLRVWNYNKSLEDSFRGVKQISVAVDNQLISPRQTGFILRKAPGNELFDFDQILRFSTNEVGDKRDRLYVEKVTYPLHNWTYKTPIVKQDFEPALFPQGFVIKLILWTTWGDPYYLGLNGVELYDFHGKRITTRPTTVTAKPHSLSDIDQQSLPVEDVRVPENLLSGKNKNTWDASDTWLAPLASSLGNSEGNLVYIAFDSPIVLSLIKFWNYSKTPERGVKDLDIYLDDLHIFSGSLRKAPHGNGAQNVGRFGSKPLVNEEFSQPVLFSTNQAQVDMEKRRVYYCGTEEQDVLCINEGQVVQESKAMYRKPDPGAEGVVVDLGLRPMTAMGRK